MHMKYFLQVLKRGASASHRPKYQRFETRKRAAGGNLKGNAKSAYRHQHDHIVLRSCSGTDIRSASPVSNASLRVVSTRFQCQSGSRFSSSRTALNWIQKNSQLPTSTSKRSARDNSTLRRAGSS